MNDETRKAMNHFIGELNDRRSKCRNTCLFSNNPSMNQGFYNGLLYAEELAYQSFGSKEWVDFDAVFEEMKRKDFDND